MDLSVTTEPSVLALKKWKVIYPVYLNGKKTVVEGRRLKREKCVDNPTVEEIKSILENAGLRVVVERKFHPREYMKDQGRVRVQLKNDLNKLINPNFPHKLAVLHYLGETFPKLKGRSSSSLPSTSAGSSSQNQGANKGKQKGKGGKRR
ncbi:hypothetical protein RvY_06097 [Ramazzottius varieornatus]|uniref:Signal recognition particle 19 kDa protein n=1 Tax=Ramazzottius varieornatus TaxID=947166 RepID=A0A1D1V712_RAMVA|nr:hypothetical protein RvY_06097 [Ramazzottius varieornatus]